MSGRRRIVYESRSRRARRGLLLKVGVWIFLFIFIFSVAGGVVMLAGSRR